MKFDREFMPHYGDAVTLAPGVQRITAPNAGPYTFHGTNSYLIGDKTPALIDPGPDDDDHLNTILSALKGRQLSHIVITHHHNDHVALVSRLKAATGAKVAAYASRNGSAPRDEQDN